MSGPAFASWSPSVVYTGSRLYVSLPVGNTGGDTAPAVWLTGGTFGTAARLSPGVFRIQVGDLAPGNNTNVNMIFDGTGLAVGGRYALTVRGTYASGNSVLGFSVNRFVVVPGVTAPPISQLDASLSVALGNASWTYTLANNEAAGSTLYVASFSIDVAAPVAITATPAGWIGQTDNATYVGWYADDSAGPPYPHQLAPGASLGGFGISSATKLSQSTAFVVTSWDHAADAAGLLFSDYISAPSLT